MTQFSSDKADPPTHFRASQGQIGTKAAMQALRPPRASGPKPGSRRSGAGKGDSPRRGSTLGMPEPPQQEEGNNNHLLLGLHHANITGLGRDLPFGLWATHNGHFQEIAPKGMEPFDWIEDA